MYLHYFGVCWFCSFGSVCFPDFFVWTCLANFAFGVCTFGETSSSLYGLALAKKRLSPVSPTRSSENVSDHFICVHILLPSLPPGGEFSVNWSHGAIGSHLFPRAVPWDAAGMLGAYTTTLPIPSFPQSQVAIPDAGNLPRPLRSRLAAAVHICCWAMPSAAVRTGHCWAPVPSLLVLSSPVVEC